MTIRLVEIDSPFRPNRNIRAVRNAATAGELLEREGIGGHVHLVRHGHRITPETVLEDGDELVACRMPAGPLIPVIVFAVVSAAIGAAISFGISLLLGRPKAETNRPSSTGGGPTYNWEGISNTRTNGTTIPVVYGKHRVGGQLLTLYRRGGTTSTTMFLHMLIGLGHGQMRRTGESGFDIRDQDFLSTRQNIGSRFTTTRSLIDHPDFAWAEGSTTSFQAIGGQLRYSGASGTARFVVRDPIGINGRNYRIRWTVEGATLTSRIRVAANVEDANQYYAVYQDNGNLILIKRIGGSDTTLHTEAGVVDGDEIRLERLSDDIELFVNDSSVYTYADVDDINSSRFGLSGVGTTGLAYIDNYRIDGLRNLPRGCLLNGVDINQYREIRGYTRVGRDRQRKIPQDFSEVIQAYNPGMPLSRAWIEYEPRDKLKEAVIVFDFPSGLYYQNPDTGNIEDQAVVVQVQYSNDDGATFAEISGSPFTFSHQLTTNFSRTVVHTPDPADATQLYRVRRTSLEASSGDAFRKDRVLFGTFNENVDEDRQSYDNVALLALRIQATDQLSGATPTVTSLVEGMTVPTWNGAGGADEPRLSYAYSQNPAWVALDILLNKRYGLGNHIGLPDIDIQSFLDWATWCDETVQYRQEDDEPLEVTDDTLAVTQGTRTFQIDSDTEAAKFAVEDFVKAQWEPINQITAKTQLDTDLWEFELANPFLDTYPERWHLRKYNLGPTIVDTRHRFNGIFEGAQTAWEALLAVCRVGRAMPMKVGKHIRIRYETNGSPVQHINESAMVAGSMEIDYIGSAERPDIVEVQYLDADKDYDQAIARAGGNPPASVAREPITRTIALYGITDRRQAIREANYHLRAMRLAKRRLRFRAPLDVIAAEAGDIISVGSTLASWSHWTGRAGGTPQILELSQDITLETGKTYQAILRLPDNRAGLTVTITDLPGTYKAGQAIRTNSSDNTTDLAEVPCTIGEATQITQDWRITRTQLGEDLSMEIEAVEYVPEIYDLVGWEEEIIDDWPEDGCIQPGATYNLPYDPFDLLCPPSGSCLEPGRLCCFAGTIDVTCSGAGCSCVTILEADQDGARIRIDTGCEGDNICINVTWTGQWWCADPDTCESCEFIISDPERCPHVVCIDEPTCNESRQTCIDICALGASFYFKHSENSSTFLLLF